MQREKITKDKEGHYIMKEGSIHQEDTMILTIYAPNSRVSNYMEQKLIELKEKTDKSPITVRDFNIPLSATNRTQ